MSLILGLMHHTHDAAAALVDRRGVLAAVEEERINRQKHSSAFPAGAIESCLECARVSFRQIEHVAYPWQPWRRALYGLGFLVRHFPGSLRVLRRRGDGDVAQLLRLPSRLREYALSRGWRPDFRRFHFIEHHLAHLAAAYFSSPFERAVVISQDFCGEYHSQLAAVGEGNRLRLLFRQAYPHSLGLVFNAVTKHLGFCRNCDEGKVMGLAPYGDERFIEDFRRLVQCRADGSFRLDTRWFDAFFYDGWTGEESSLVTRRFVDRFGPARKAGEEINDRHRAIARGVQALLSRYQTHLVDTLTRQTGCRDVCLAGGIALNACVNGQLLDEGHLDRLHIPPAAGDAGASLGAALAVRHLHLGIRERTHADPWLGPEFSAGRIRHALQNAGLSFDEPADLCRTLAAALAAGRIVAWFQGRMEFGPRALGSRSLLADPRRREMRDFLNQKIKHRELFRPFAPAITREAFPEFFYARGDSPYMLKVFRARERGIRELPAAIHVDGTARVQTVDRKTLPLFHRLLESFARESGVPALLNTSLNDRGEPIVASPEDAIRFFRRVPVDMLAIGPCLVCRTNNRKELRDS